MIISTTRLSSLVDARADNIRMVARMSLAPDAMLPGSRLNSISPGSRHSISPGSRLNSVSAGSRLNSVSAGSKLNSIPPGSNLTFIIQEPRDIPPQHGPSGIIRKGSSAVSKESMIYSIHPESADYLLTYGAGKRNCSPFFQQSYVF